MMTNTNIGIYKQHSRKSLWDWFAAAFPKAKYCLCSATLTDEAVEDILGITSNFQFPDLSLHLPRISWYAARGHQDPFQEKCQGKHFSPGKPITLQ